MELGSKICKLRKSINLSQEQLSEKLNVTRQTISNWELGQTAPDIFQAKELSKIFKVSLDELTDNDMKDIIVEKIINTEKMSSNITKILKFLSIVIICFLATIIVMNLSIIIKKSQNQEQIISKLYTQQFVFTLNDEQYSYYVQYDKNYKLYRKWN